MFLFSLLRPSFEVYLIKLPVTEAVLLRDTFRKISKKNSNKTIEVLTKKMVIPVSIYGFHR